MFIKLFLASLSLLFFNITNASYLDYNSYVTINSSTSFSINIPGCVSYSNITTINSFTKFDLINSTHILNNNLSDNKQLEIWILNLYDNNLNKKGRIKFFCKNGTPYGYQYDNSVYLNGNLYYTSNNSLYNYILYNQQTIFLNNNTTLLQNFNNLNYYGPINNQHPTGAEFYNYVSTSAGNLIYSLSGSFVELDLTTFTYKNNINKSYNVFGPLDYSYKYIIQNTSNSFIETNNINLDPSTSFNYKILNIKDWSNPNFIISLNNNNNIEYLQKNYYCSLDYPTCSSNNLCTNSLNQSNNKVCSNSILNFGTGGLLTTPPSNPPTSTSSSSSGTIDPYSSITSLFKNNTGSINIGNNNTGTYINKTQTGYTIQDFIFSCNSKVENIDIGFISFLNFGFDFKGADLGLPDFLTPNINISFHPFSPLSCLFKSTLYIKDNVLYINNNNTLKDLITMDLYSLYNNLNIITFFISLMSFLGLIYLIKN